MRNGTKKLIGTIVFCGAFAGVCVLLNLRGKEDYTEKYAGYDLTSDVTGLEREGTYTGYLHEHEGATFSDVLEHTRIGGRVRTWCASQG